MNTETAKNKIFRNLIGAWNISREIENFGRASGVATFAYAEVNTINYREDLKVEPFKADSYEAFREYIYKYIKEEDKIIMYFKDLQMFSELETCGESKLSGEHVCSKDNYKVIFDFLNEDKFVVLYDVKGPEKDYKMTTTYIRNC